MHVEGAWMHGVPNKRIKLTRRSVDCVTRNRRARSLSAVRWTGRGRACSC